MKRPTLSSFVLLLIIALSGPVPNGLADRVLSNEPSDSASEAAPVTPDHHGATTNDSSAFFDIGVLIGKVEQGAWEGAEPDTLVPLLVQIRERVAESGGGRSPVKELEALIEAMENATESRDLHGQIVAFRKALANRIAQHDQAPIVDPPGDEPFDCDQGSWEGVWETSWGDMTLVFDDEGRFHGTYGSSQHAVSGTFDPDHPKELRGRWSHFGSTATGGIRFEMKAPNRFEGGWSGEIPVKGAGSGWSGTRRKTHHSEVLIVPIGEATVAQAPEDKVPIWTQPFMIKKGFSVHGENVDFPLVRLFTLAPETGDWEPAGPDFSEIGASLHRIPAGGTFKVNLSLPEPTARRKISVEFARSPDPEEERDEDLITLRTRPLLLVPPKARPRAVDPPPKDEASPAVE